MTLRFWRALRSSAGSGVWVTRQVPRDTRFLGSLNLLGLFSVWALESTFSAFGCGSTRVCSVLCTGSATWLSVSSLDISRTAKADLKIESPKPTYRKPCSPSVSEVKKSKTVPTPMSVDMQTATRYIMKNSSLQRQQGSSSIMAAKFHPKQVRWLLPICRI